MNTYSCQNVNQSRKRTFFDGFKGESSFRLEVLKICWKCLFILEISQTVMECKVFGWVFLLSDSSPVHVRSVVLITACRSRYRQLPLWSTRLDDSVLTIALQPVIFQIPGLRSQCSVGCFSGTFILLADYLPSCFLPCKLPPTPTPLIFHYPLFHLFL